MGIGHLAHRFDVILFRFHTPSNPASFAMAGVTTALLATLILLPMTSLAEPEGQKYALNDCIMNISPHSDWYKQEALVMDIVDSELHGTKTYVLYFPHQKHSNAEIDQRRNDIGFFGIYAVNLTTVKVSDQACEARK